ncbi:MAG: FtsW/RodA/SpoVE family cell cycle protein [Dysgonamonadaceae bacterium]|jgi:cell division protein FtsW|nr:FtsW/RodA/SpoVE family cell cycle protein [Dysgonamonadaceae bacterium]
MDFFNKIFRGDRVIWMIFAFLFTVSIIEVYSASSTLTFRTDYWRPIMEHTLFLLVGLGIVLLVHSFKPKFFSIFAVALPFTWFLLIATRLFGTEVNGAFRRFLGFQPSEIAKLCLITCVAFILSRRKNESSEDSAFKWICVSTVITCALIFFDNFSTAGLLYGIIIFMLFIGQISIKKIGFFSLATVFVIALILAFSFKFPDAVKNTPLKRASTWTSRISDYKEKEDIKSGNYVIDDDNYQVSHAKIALAQGGIFGRMPGNSQQRDYLPQAYSDFIFAIIIEELGLVGGIAVLALYVFLFIRAGIIAGRCTKLFPKLLVMGSALMLVAQALANIAVAVDLIPVTGQPLPLVSRGGTSILVTCAFFGIILSVSRYENPRGISREEAIVKEMEAEKQAAEAAENWTGGETGLIADTY